MVPQGPPPTPLGGMQQVPPPSLRSSSGLVGGQAGSDDVFPSLLTPQNQFNNMNMLGNVPNVSSLLHPSFGNGGPSAGLSGPGQSQRGLMDGGAKSDPFSGQGQLQFSNPLPTNQQSQHLNRQNLPNSQQQFSVPGISQQSQQFQGTVPNAGPIKLEPQANGDQSMRSSGPVKMEPQGPSLYLQQQQQLLLSRQSPQQRLMQMQMQQQQQLLKSMPQQRSPAQSQFVPQNLPVRPPVKPVYEPGMCARRLTHFMYQQQHRPEDNSIEFWRKFVAEYFAPNAKKKWCISMHGNGRQTTGVLPQETWQCEICNRKPGRGFEATVEVLPRLFKIKYESGTLEELLYVDMPREYQNSSGQIVLDYAKAIQESVFEQLRVVRDGQLRIVFSPDLKICSWEFCARRHEELIPRRLLIPQVSQVSAAAQKCQTNNAENSSSSNNSVSELQTNCNMFVASARQLAKSLEVPLVNDLGYTKRYVRCLQISEVVNSMKDLIDYSRETGAGPAESLIKFPRRKNPPSEFQGHPQPTEGPTQHEQQQQMLSQSSNHDIKPAHQASNPQPSGTSSIPYAGNNNFQMESQGPSSMVPQAPPSQLSVQTSTPSLANNGQQTSHGGSLPGNPMNPVTSPNLSMPHDQQQQQPSLSSDDTNGPQSSVQKILQDMMIASQLSNNGGGGMTGMGGKSVNGVLPANKITGINGSLSHGLGQSDMVNGIQPNVGNNSLSVNGGAGMPLANQRQHGLGNQLLSNLGTVNGFNNLHFDWEASP